MKAQNLLIIVSDQHHLKLVGYAGHEMVRTPNLDAWLPGESDFQQRIPPVRSVSLLAPVQ